MPELKNMIGSTIHALVPFIDTKKIQELKLHGVEDGGIWVESQSVTDQLLGAIQIPTAPKTLVLFLPWHEIKTIFGSHDAPSLSERSFGIKPRG